MFKQNNSILSNTFDYFALFSRFELIDRVIVENEIEITLFSVT